MFNNQIIAGSSGQGGDFYSTTIDQSLRCNGSNEHLTRTPSSSGNRRTWTFSAWVKLGVDGVRFPLIEAYSNGTNFTMAVIHTDGRIQFYTITSATDYGGITTQYLRDPSAWYHIVFRFDSTQSTAADRIRLYVNGTQQETNPWTDYGQMPQNYDSFINHTVPNNILKNTNSSQYGQGYIAEVHHVDGTSYGPDTFAETKNGVWVPKAVSGVSYGTNGFYLNFADSSDIGNNANSTDGTNDFTVNNFTASDVVSDSPTNNFATWNSVHRVKSGSNAATYTEGNLKAASGGNSTHVFGSFGITPTDTQGYYWEVKAISIDTARSYVGIVAPEGGDGGNASYQFAKKFVLNRNDDLYGNDGSGGSTVNLTSWTTNDILMFAYKNGKIWIGRTKTSGSHTNRTSNVGEQSILCGRGSNTNVPVSLISVILHWVSKFTRDFISNSGDDLQSSTKTVDRNLLTIQSFV